MAKQGILLTTSHLLPDTSITSDTFLHWYDNIHIPDVLAAKDAPPLALRYQNTNPSAEFTYVVIFQLPDTTWVTSQALKDVPKHWDGWEGPNGEPKRGIAFANIKPRTYEVVHVSESSGEKSGRGPCLVSEAIDPGEGMNDDIEDWYTKERFDALAKVPGHRSSALYKVLPTYRGSVPLYMALHEFTEPPSSPSPLDVNLKGSSSRLLDNTARSQNVVESAKTFETNTWLLATEFGKAKEGARLW